MDRGPFEINFVALCRDAATKNEKGETRSPFLFKLYQHLQSNVLVAIRLHRAINGFVCAPTRFQTTAFCFAVNGWAVFISSKGFVHEKFSHSPTFHPPSIHPDHRA